MELLIDLAKNVYYQIALLRHLEHSERYKTIFEKYNDFTKTYPLVVKYMCFYGVFDEQYFSELVLEQQQKRPTYERGFELQALYVKKVLIKHLKMSKMSAKKASNQELADILSQVKNIQRQEAEIKRRNKYFKTENIKELRKELYEMVKD
jgi:hypothetical protein